MVTAAVTHQSQQFPTVLGPPVDFSSVGSLNFDADVTPLQQNLTVSSTIFETNSESSHSSSNPVPPSHIALAKRPHLASVDSATTEDSVSTHSRDSGAGPGGPTGLNLPGIFGRRGSLMPGRPRPNTGGGVNSTASSMGAGGAGRQRPSTSNGGGGSFSSADPGIFEMTAVGARNLGKGQAVSEADRRKDEDFKKQDEALAKWRKWVIDQPTTHVMAIPMKTSSSSPGVNGHCPRRGVDSSPVRSRTPSLAGITPMTPMTPASPHGVGIVVDVSPTGMRENLPRTSGSEPSPYPHSSKDSTGSGLGAGGTDSGMDFYLTDSVRALRDVELAVDPEFLAKANAPDSNGTNSLSASRQRQRRLSTHPRMSEQPNPFVDIDAILSRRGIRPLVLELVHALGAYIDAVWCTRNPGRPCPWYRSRSIPDSAPVGANGGAGLDVSAGTGWRSWAIASVQEGKTLGLLSDPPTSRDVSFWEDEVRYGLRDVDEAVNRRKDLGWAFAQAVVNGRYGDIHKTNVLAGDNEAGNVARLLNDLEEAIWGDAVPAPTDLAYEVDPDFDPFSVYREGDVLIGVDANYNTVTSKSGNNSPLSRFFGNEVAHSHSDDGHGGISHGGMTRTANVRAHPLADGEGGRKDRGTASLDFTAFGDLRSMTKDEMLELGRQRHKEWAASVQFQQGEFDPVLET